MHLVFDFSLSMGKSALRDTRRTHSTTLFTAFSDWLQDTGTCSSLLSRGTATFKIQDIFIGLRRSNCSATASAGTTSSRKHADPRLIKQAIRRHSCWGGRRNRKFIHAFARAVALCRNPSSRRLRRRRCCGLFVVYGCIIASSSSSSLAGPRTKHDILRENARVIHRGRDIYLQGTCITRGKEAWWRRGRPRGRSVNWSPRRYRWSTATDAIVMERLLRSAR